MNFNPLIRDFFHPKKWKKTTLLFSSRCKADFFEFSPKNETKRQLCLFSRPRFYGVRWPWMIKKKKASENLWQVIYLTIKNKLLKKKTIQVPNCERKQQTWTETVLLNLILWALKSFLLLPVWASSQPLLGVLWLSWSVVMCCYCLV